MSRFKPVLSVVLASFVAFTLWVLVTGGSFGEIVTAFGGNPWILQVTIDLVLALSMVCVWMWNDARAHGRNPVPWLIATVFTGSIAPLTYLLLRPSEDDD